MAIARAGIALGCAAKAAGKATSRPTAKCCHFPKGNNALTPPPAGGNRHDRNLLDLMAIAEHSRPVVQAPAAIRMPSALQRGVPPAVDRGFEPGISDMVREHWRGVERRAKQLREHLVERQAADQEVLAMFKAAVTSYRDEQIAAINIRADEHRALVRDALNLRHRRWV